MTPAAARIVLVAMPRSGETFLARDTAGTLWLVPPTGVGPSTIVPESAIDEAVRNHDWDPVGEQFDSWDDLDAARKARAEALAPGRDVGVTDYDADDVRRILRGARSRIGSDDVTAARRILVRLLDEVRLVREDDDLLTEAVELLKETESSATPPPRRDVAGVRPEHRERAERLNLVRA